MHRMTMKAWLVLLESCKEKLCGNVRLAFTRTAPLVIDD